MRKNVDVASLKTQLQVLGEHQAVADARQLIEQLQTQLKFEQPKDAALSFELARLKQWRFGKPFLVQSRRELRLLRLPFKELSDTDV